MSRVLATGEAWGGVSSAFAIALLVCATASAQTPASEIRDHVKEGQKVAVTDEQGRELKGRLIAVAPDSLTLATGGRREEVRYTQIVKIDRVDDLKNGAVIGLVAGAGLFALDAVVSSRDGITLNPAGYVVIGGLYVGAAAAIGAGIDALIGGTRNIYQRGGGARISVAPLIGKDRIRATIAISWK